MNESRRSYFKQNDLSERKSKNYLNWTAFISPAISDIVQSSIFAILKLSIFLERPFWTATKIQFVRIDFHFE